MHEAVRSRLNSWGACCSSVQNLSPHWLNINLKFRIYGTVILCVVFCVCETTSVTLRKNILRVVGQIFWAKREEVTGD